MQYGTCKYLTNNIVCKGKIRYTSLGYIRKSLRKTFLKDDAHRYVVFSLHKTFYLYGTRQKIWIIKIYPDPDNGWDSKTPRVSLIYRVRLAGHKQDIKAKDRKERSGLCRKSKVRPKTNEVICDVKINERVYERN